MEPCYIRCVAGVDKIDYPDDPGLPSDSLIKAKLLLNSTIYDEKEGALFMSFDLKNFFLDFLMEPP